MNPADPHDPDTQALEHALAVFTANLEGQLRFDEHFIHLKYVFDPRDGRLIASVPVAVLHAADLVLDIPEENDDALQLLVTAEEAPESIATDRWLAYHGHPEHVRWAAFWIDSARHGPWVFDGDALTFPNLLAADEPVLCKKLNADPARLAALCQRFAGVPIPKPVCVGVDPRGLHVRASFGVVRVRFDSPATTATAAIQSIDAMLTTI
ncbi:MAG: hypothetical protein JNK58_08845 [Phycisphaerae bacterium]|nr:hypothetical protein [Phycisphaerae bacterium]